MTDTSPEPRSTAGMTTKVVKGSLWTLAGQFAPMAVSFFTTPFIIRKLGAESYGVLILIWSIPTYLGFADLGMSTASTKFAAEAYGADDREREARTIWTSAAIALATSLPFAAAIIVFSDVLVRFLNIPDRMRNDASLAGKFTAVLMVVTLLNLVFNSPQLVRLRMDVNSSINAGFRIFGLLASAMAIYWFGAIAMAALCLLIASVAQLAVQVVAGRWLFAELMPVRFSREAVNPLLKYGSPLAVAAIAGLAIINLDKVVLARVASVEMVAYYSVAFTFASLSLLASSAATQSLIPAFAQLNAPDKQEQLRSLFGRGVRINIFGTLPLLVALFVIGKPLIRVWAGDTFADKSILPLHILLIGVFFSLVMVIPYSLLLAGGRTRTIAKLLWAELFPFLALLIILTSWFGIIGAAIAWSVRALADSVLIWVLARKITGVSFNFFEDRLIAVAAAICVMALPILATVIWSDSFVIPASVFAVSAGIYSAITWKHIISANERAVVRNSLSFT